MNRQRLVEYTLTAEETREAILEYIARKEGQSSVPAYRWVIFKTPPDKGRNYATHAVALTEEKER